MSPERSLSAWLSSLPAGRQLVAHMALGLFIASIPVCYLNASGDLAWVVQPLGLFAVLVNLPEARLRQVHPSMLALGALWCYFALTAFDTGVGYVSDFFSVFGKFVALAVLMNLMVRERSQVIAVMGALALSAVAVAYLSRVELLASRQMLVASTTAANLENARTAGIFANSNVFGTYAVLAAIAAVIVATSAKHAISLLIAIPALACSGFLAYFSGSRKAILGMALMCVLALWQAFQARPGGRNRGLPVILAVLVLAGGFLWWRTNPFITRFSTSDASYIAREDLFHAALAMWQTAPFLGGGYRTFELHDVSGLYTHSTPMEMLVSGGLVACGLYLMLFAAVFRSLLISLRYERDPRERLLLFGIGYFWLALFLFSLFTVIIEEKLFLALSGVLCGYLGHKDAVRTERPPGGTR